MTQADVRVEVLDPESADAHADRIAAIYVASMGFSDDAGRRLVERIEKSPALVIGAFEDAELVGFLFGFQLRESNWWVQQIAPHLPDGHDYYRNSFELNELMVDPSKQGRGIGRQLLEKLNETTNYDHFLLGARKDNVNARKLYERLGYRVIVDDFQYAAANEIHVIMAKSRVQG